MADLSELSPEELAVALEGPALAPPQGITPNFDNPPNQNTLGVGVTALGLVLTTAMLLLRLYVRFIVNRRAHFDDCIPIASYEQAFFVALISIGYPLLEAVGFLVHQWDVRVRDMITYLHAFLISSNLHILAVGLLKVAVLSDWVRIFVPAGTRGSFFWACYIVMGINILWTMVFIIAANLGSHGPWRKKAGVSAIFCLGLFSCVAAANRLPTAITLDNSSDVLYHYSALALWAYAEYTAGLLVLCGPSIPKAVDQVRNSEALASLRSWVVGFGARGSSQLLAHHGIHASQPNPVPANRHAQRQHTAGQVESDRL
ncbi:hypothetical protein PG996_011812 [Apiospora saccharicola]|uniref:Rhodopsin domain-containing protein n=1 Tax=Apiospora saccharicola TaxID=335842 RepID=A0ABR1UII4_9PEZI